MKYKKYIIFITIILFIFYCRHQVINHNIPIANIKFVKIEKNIKYENSFYLYFTSDVELIENLEKEHVNGGIKCFFLNKSINKNDILNYKGYQLKSVDNLVLVSKVPNKYTYKIKTSFKDNRDNISSEEKTESKMLNVTNLINEGNINCLSCVATSVAYMNIPKRYISNTMYIPKENLKIIME